MTKTALAKFKVEEIALVCGKPYDERLPCPPDDSDVACNCFKCGCDLLRRASSNPEWQAVCFGCWEQMQ